MPEIFGDPRKDFHESSSTARRGVLPGRFKWRFNIILQHAQAPQGQCFEVSQTGPRRRTLNP